MNKEPVTYKIRELDPDIIAPSTKRMNIPEQGGSKIVVIGKPGCHLKGTKILKYDGSICEVQDVVVGDLLMGDDSQPRRVLDLCRGQDHMWKIQPQDGMEWVVNTDHILSLRNKLDGSILDLSLREYMKDPSLYSQYSWYRVGVEFPEKEIKIDPLMLGALIKYDLESIPWDYIYNSMKKRLLLLGGIIYTQASFNEEKGKYQLPKYSPVVSQQILYLCRSLGLMVWETENGIEIKDHPTILSIKNHRKTTGEYNLDFDFEIQPWLGGEILDYYGFTLDGNGRFLLGDFSVTHNTGKSTLISSILFEKSHIFPVGIAMSASESSNHHYSGSMFPTSFVYNGLDKGQIEEFLKRQEFAKKHLPNPWSVLVLDDCMEDPKLFNDPLFGKIFKNGRHSKLLLVIGLQYAMDIKPAVRTCIDGTFILREPNIKNRKAIFENYAGILGDFQIFCDLMDQLTEDYTALYIDNSKQSNNIEDCVFWYKPKIVPNTFKFGCDEYWEFHNERYDPSSENKIGV